MNDHDLAKLLMDVAETLHVIREEIHRRQGTGHIAIANKPETHTIRQQVPTWRNALLATACRLTLATEAQS